MPVSRHPPGATRLAVALFLLLSGATTTLAHHPGAELDTVMSEREKYFQHIDRKSPDFELRDADGHTVTLADLGKTIVVLNFIYTGCPDICPLHAERLAEVQAMINRTPMKDRVRFVTITTDPVNDTAEILKAYGSAHGLDPVNWSFLTTKPGQPEDATRTLAKAFGHSFVKTGDSYQVHSVVTHIIDRDGRWAANFHGLKFAPVNLVLYLNGLTNRAHTPEKPKPPGAWEPFRNLF